MQFLALAAFPLCARILAPNSRWRVTKKLIYERGGESGTFEGTAVLSDYSDADASGVLVSETGRLRLPSSEHDASRHTLFVLEGQKTLALRFVDDPLAAVSRPFAAGTLIRDERDGCLCEGLASGDVERYLRRRKDRKRFPARACAAKGVRGY